MAPKALPELRLPGFHKCTLATNLADINNVDSAAIKHLRIEADLLQQCQPSVETVPNDNDNSTPLNVTPQKVSNIFEAADGSDDNENMPVGDVGAIVIKKIIKGKKPTSCCCCCCCCCHHCFNMFIGPKINIAYI